MDLFEDLIKGIDWQTADLKEFYHNFFRHFQNEFIFFPHHFAPKKTPADWKKANLLFSGGLEFKKNLQKPSLRAITYLIG